MLHCSGMRWREVARSLIVPACCCVLNLFLFVWARMPPRNGSPLWDQVAPVAALLSAASACVLLALPAGLALILLLGRRAHYGRMEALRACRVTYRVATGLALLVAGVVWTAVATTITLWSGAPPMWVVAILGASAVSAVFVCNARGHGPGPTVVLLNLVWVAYVGAWFWDTAPPLFVVSALSAAASVAILALTADVPDAGFEIPRVISLRGRPAAADGPRALRPLIAVVSRTVGVPPPAHVLFTLDAETAWVPLDVVVGDDTLAGGTLCVSLPMCRVLERGELAGLVAFELAYEKAVPLRCRRFISVAITRLSHYLNRASRDLLARSALSAARMPLELWREMWGASHAEACLGAVQRAAVVSGRETIAAALSSQSLASSFWPRFFTEIGNALSAGQQEAGADVSRRLADRCVAATADPDVQRTFESTQALTNNGFPFLAAAVSRLGVDTAAVVRRLQRWPEDPAIELIDGAAAIEHDLAREVVSSVLPAPPAPDGVPEKLVVAPTLPPRSLIPATVFSGGGLPVAVQPRWHERAALTDVEWKGTLTLDGKHGHVEEVVFWGLMIGALLLSAWTFGAPLVHRAFPEWENTRNGPRGFPVTVHIGEQSLGVTNRSSQSWSCRAEVGYQETRLSFYFTFALEAGQTRELPYDAFAGRDLGTDVAFVHAAARGRGTLLCAETTGLSHYWGW